MLLLLTIELVHVADSSWMSLFLYNGDSLTLPLFREAIAQHQPWIPIVSTQLLIFPEGVIYAVCSAVTSSIRASLVLNAYANLLLIYAATRLLASGVVARPSRRGCATAAVCSCLIGLMLLEVQIDGANLQFATLLLLTTYYYGLVLGGIVVLGTTVRWIDAGPARRGAWRWVAVVTAVSTLTYFSDPPFLLWVTTPLVLTALGLGLLRRLSLQAGCRGHRLPGREPARRHVAETAVLQCDRPAAGSYVKFGQFGGALHHLLQDAAADVVATPPNESNWCRRVVAGRCRPSSWSPFSDEPSDRGPRTLPYRHADASSDSASSHLS